MTFMTFIGEGSKGEETDPIHESVFTKLLLLNLVCIVYMYTCVFTNHKV